VDPANHKDDKPDAAGASAYWSGAHSKHRLRYHLTFVPKYRKRVLQGAIAVRLKELLTQACEVNRWKIHELSIQPDHVHLLIQCPPKDSVAKIMQIIKGGSSYVLRQEFPDLQEFLWGDSFWADGYFADTVGQVQIDVVQRYIREQQEPSV
jgi:putative transposase